MSTAAPNSSQVTVRGLSARYGDREALKGVDFHADTGEIVGLLGPNGSGKSTILKVLTGLVAASGGTVESLGQIVHVTSRRWLSTLGVVFQAPCVDIRLTCAENLSISLQMHGFSRAQIKARVGALLADAGLSERSKDLAADLSGGLRRRLDLARAIAHGPKLLLLDEPTSGLDERSFRRTWAQLEAARTRDGLTILVATHRPEEAARCDRLVVLNEGSVVTTETPDALLAMVGGDRVSLSGSDPNQIADALRALGQEPRIDGDEVSITVPAGHEFVVTAVAAVGADAITALAVRRPSLADAFMALTGEDLHGDPSEIAEAA